MPSNEEETGTVLMKIAQSLGFFIGETCYPHNPIYEVSCSYEGDNPLVLAIALFKKWQIFNNASSKNQKCLRVHSAHVSCFEVDAIFLSEPSSVY